MTSVTDRPTKAFCASNHLWEGRDASRSRGGGSRHVRAWKIVHSAVDSTPNSLFYFILLFCCSVAHAIERIEHNKACHCKYLFCACH